MLAQNTVPNEGAQPLADLDVNREILRKRRAWYILAAILLVLSLVARQPLILLAGIFTLLVGAVPEIWFRRALRHLVVRQQLNEQHLFFGETATISLTVENRKFLPLPWLEVDNTIDPPLSLVSARDSRQQVIHRDSLASTWLLWSYQRVTRRYRLRCQARGFHRFGPIKLNCSDPFGWMGRELRAEAYETLLVYPLIAPIEALLPAANPMGDRVGPRHLLEDPLWFAGNREYQLGDDPRRIDWKATARVGELRSKIYESTVMRRMLILLDTWTYMADVNGVDFELQEFCISAAASLAMWGLDEGYMVGLLTNSSAISATDGISAQINTDDIIGTEAELYLQKPYVTEVSSPGVSVPFAQDHEQYTEILTTLARLVPNYNTPIEHVMEQEEEMLQPGSTILLVCSLSTLSMETIEQLVRLRARGNRVNLILVGSLNKGQEMVDTADLPVFHIGGREKWHELIRTVGEEKGAAVGASTTPIELG